MCTYHAFAVASLATISHAIERESERVFLSVGTYKMRHPYMRSKEPRSRRVKPSRRTNILHRIAVDLAPLYHVAARGEASCCEGHKSVRLSY